MPIVVRHPFVLLKINGGSWRLKTMAVTNSAESSGGQGLHRRRG